MQADAEDIKISKPIRSRPVPLRIGTAPGALSFRDEHSRGQESIALIRHHRFMQLQTLHLNLDANPPDPVLKQAIVRVSARNANVLPSVQRPNYIHGETCLGDDSSNSAQRQVTGLAKCFENYFSFGVEFIFQRMN